MIDSDLAELYQIETKNLKRQVRRNSLRFPPDFMFELSEDEISDVEETDILYLLSQNLVSPC